MSEHPFNFGEFMIVLLIAFFAAWAGYWFRAGDEPVSPLPDKIASVIYCEKGYLIIEEWPGESLPDGEAL